MKKIVVGVSVLNAEGDRVPVGLMNAQQALSLPKEMDFEVLLAGEDAEQNEILMDRAKLKEHMDRIA